MKKKKICENILVFLCHEMRRKCGKQTGNKVQRLRDYIHKTTMAVFRLHIVPFTVQALYEHWLNFPPSLLPYHVNTRRASAMWFQSFEVCELR